MTAEFDEEPRGPAAQGHDRLFDDAVAAMMTALREHAVEQISLASIALALGTDEQALTQRFEDFDGLVVATLMAWGAQRAKRAAGIARTAGAVAYLRNLLEQGIEDPACSRLVLTAASHAAAPGVDSAAALRELWVHFHATVLRSLARDVEYGRQPPTMDPTHGTEQLLAIYEGLQFQWFLRPHMNLLAAWDRATTRLQSGWSERYTEPVWSI